MIVVVKSALGQTEKVNIAGGFPLGRALSEYRDGIEAVQINGRFRQDWESFVGSSNNDDRVTVFIRTGWQFLPQIIIALIQIAISVTVALLTPKPDKPNFNNRKEESSSIAGLHNAVESGTPRFYSFGQNRIYGTVISTGVSVADDGKSMKGKILYYMGRTDGNGIESIDEIFIDDQPIENHPDIGIITRFGTPDQDVIPGFENVSQVFSDNRTFSISSPITYTTRGDDVNQVRAIIAFPTLSQINSKGKLMTGTCGVKIERKLTADPPESFAEVAGSPFNVVGRTLSPIYFPIEITLGGVGAGDAWDLRFTKIDPPGVAETNLPPDPSLFDLEEIQWTTRNYPNDALLALTDIPSADFPSLEQLRVSALVKGNLVPVPDGAGGFTTGWTRERVWIHRYLTTSKELGLGARWEESEFDDDWAAVEQAYYNELVDGHDGDEPRDFCDLMVNARQDGWDWLKKLCGEGRAVFIPSGLQWRYVIDRPRDPLMLISEPGNIMENSVIAEPLQPDPAINRVILEYRDGDNFDLPNVIQLVDPDFVPGEPIVADSVKLDTIKRESQAAREAMYYRKKQALVRRHWQANGAMNFLYAEPMDTAYFFYPTSSHKRGWSGFARGGGATTLLLDQSVDLETGETYQVFVHHKEDNTVETRTVSSAAGNRVILEVTPDFTQVPADGDIWSVDKVATEQRIVRIQDVDFSDDEPVRLILSDYIPEVYTTDPLPSKSIRRFFDLQRMAPLPLRAVKVTEEVAQNLDGSTRSTLIFDVTPSFSPIGGQLQGTSGGGTVLTLAVTEPALADFYRNWDIEITEGPGAGEKRKIIDYNVSRGAVTSGLWTVQPTSASLYKLTRERYGELTGFRVELATDGVNWNTLDTYAGIRGEYRERVEGGVTWFRFTPISNGVENKLARWTTAIATTGDTSAPAAPVLVTLASHIKQVSIDIFQARPTAEDLAGFEVEFYQIPTGGGVGPLLCTVQVPVTQDNALTGNLHRRYTQNFSEMNYGDNIFGRARAYDYAQNKSGFTINVATVTLRAVDTGDIAEGALTEFAEYVNDASQVMTGVTPVEIAAVTLATVGRPVLLMIDTEVENQEDAETGPSGPIMLELRRGAAYSGSTLIAARTRVIHAADFSGFSFARVNWPAPGTYPFKLWMFESTPSINWSATYRHILALEIKDQAQA